MKRFFTSTGIPCIAFICALVIFIADLASPPDAGIDTLYVAALLLSFNQPGIFLKSITCFASAATLADLFITVDLAHAPAAILVNKAISLLTIWISMGILIKYRQLYEYHLKEKEERVHMTRQVLFFTSHEIRKPICTLSGLMNLIYETKLDEGEKEMALEYLRDQVKELDECTRKLSDHVYHDNIESPGFPE